MKTSVYCIVLIAAIAINLPAQINPAIPLAIQPPVIANPMDTLRQVLELKRLQLEIENQQRLLDSQKNAAWQQRQQQQTTEQPTTGAGAEMSFHIEKFMKPVEFSTAGLDRLSTNELKSLNAWLQKYTDDLADLIANLAIEKFGKPAEVIEDRIEGAFNGWDGETIFKLTNGQIWQQSSYAYRYHYAYRPEVVIYPATGGFKMHVDGVDDSVSVKRLK
jgi:hypothetical protein